ncbi:hypothetical protein P389DRAFT_99756 [Cystobasidium minutum MCA 4210]|uniref:uncharacterized protein n=1 Tax=Cystobasidium minutum MCA 4210 TaxID=1397322 RepID=UPI0034CED8A7|eukprot:jgi/Rhomi1/99756/CE99755_3897
MSFNLASGPKSQFLAWTAVAGFGVVAYITVKKRTNEKKRIDMQNKLAAQASAEAGPSTSPVYRGGGVGISTASGAYQAAMGNKSSSKAESHFLPPSSTTDFPSTAASAGATLNSRLAALSDYRKTDPPLSLREYREKMALLDRNMD